MGIEFCWENFWNLHIKISMENWLFPFSIPSSRTFVILYSSGNNTIFLQQLFQFRGRGKLPPLRGAHVFPDYFALWEPPRTDCFGIEKFPAKSRNSIEIIRTVNPAGGYVMVTTLENQLNFSSYWLIIS